MKKILVTAMLVFSLMFVPSVSGFEFVQDPLGTLIMTWGCEDFGSPTCECMQVTMFPDGYSGSLVITDYMGIVTMYGYIETTYKFELIPCNLFLSVDKGNTYIWAGYIE